MVACDLHFDLSADSNRRLESTSGNSLGWNAERVADRVDGMLPIDGWLCVRASRILDRMDRICGSGIRVTASLGVVKLRDLTDVPGDDLRVHVFAVLWMTFAS